MGPSNINQSNFPGGGGGIMLHSQRLNEKETSERKKK